MAASVRMNKLKEAIQVKKNSFTSTTRYMCIVVMKEDEENESGKLQPVRFRDYWNLEDVHMR